MGKFSQSSLGRLTYGVDLVFCIDVTESMGMDHILEIVKDNALNFYQDFQEAMEEKKKKVSSLRIRIVAFRDYYYDGEHAMFETRFFEFPSQAKDFKVCLNSITPDGGGDDPEDGLEALAFAMHSDWTMAEKKRRHVIVVWSDASTHDLGFGKDYEGYPDDLPEDFNELTMWWGSKTNPGVMDQASKRLVLFTPDKQSWDKIARNWDKTIHYPCNSAEDLLNADYSQIMNAISNSI